MRSVLIAIDFVKDVDNSFKVLEINTGIIAAPISVDPYFNKTELDNLISENNITEIELILLNAGPVYAINSDYPNDTLNGFGAMFDKYYSGLTITRQVVDSNNQVTPSTVDSPNKLIIRQSYDSTALIDETYAKDNFEFLKLLYDSSPNSIVNTYINHPTLGFDMIGDSLKDNGNHPNYIVKQRYPTTDYSEYPKVYKIETQEQLSDLKTNLPPNTLLQEYVINTNDLENGKLKTYRSIGLVYGSELNVINLIDPFIHTNSCGIDNTVDTINTEIQVWERPKYLQKYGKRYDGIKYNSDSTNLILKNDGTLVSPSQLSLNDSLKTINLFGLPDNENEFGALQYSGNTEEVFSASTISSTTIQSIVTINASVWIRYLTLENGLKFSDVDTSLVLIKRNEILIFVPFSKVELGDEFVIVNKNTNLFETSAVVSDYYSYSRENVYSIDVEDIDLYLTMDESTQSPNYFIIQHNDPICRCWYPGYMMFWRCDVPCDRPDLYTGFNANECYALGIGAPYCNEVVCCISEPYDPGNPVPGTFSGGEPCPFCTNSKLT
jgi:hypothetical protein